MASILIREVIAIDENAKIEPVLSFFKKNDSHLGIVTKVVEQPGLDPELQKIGIITLEDIIEELLQEEIEDEREVEELKGQRRRMKEKLILLFSDH